MQMHFLPPALVCIAWVYTNLVPVHQGATHISGNRKNDYANKLHSKDNILAAMVSHQPCSKKDQQVCHIQNAMPGSSLFCTAFGWNGIKIVDRTWYGSQYCTDHTTNFYMGHRH